VSPSPRTSLKQLKATIGDLRSQIGDLHERFPNLSDEDLFVVWFLHAYLIDDESRAAEAITGVSRDKSVDAVYVDDSAKAVFIVQGKYRQEVMGKAESRAEVTDFARLANSLLKNEEDFEVLCQDVDPLVEARLKQARERVRKRDYKLHLHYVTLGRCSGELKSEAAALARPAKFVLFNGKDVMSVLDDYLDGVAPPIPVLDLPIESGGKAQASGTTNRFDPESEIESWVFSMSGGDVGDLFDKAGIRLFARNIRGFLGNTNINEAMEETLGKRPEYFWYFNNGVTIVCDFAEKIQKGGREILRVANPQVINGQQTTRVLSARGKSARKASLLVRVIRIPRDSDRSARRFDELVSRIVEATNWQNAIRASDLMSNDREQVRIEREFRKVGYQYLRKRQTKREARRSSLTRYRFIIKKEDIAQSVAACRFDPAVVREGKEGLFEERYYSSIFNNAKPNHYLNRYWMMRRVSNAAKGYPARAYAKWVVLHFIWDEIGRDVDGRGSKFRRACERNEDSVLTPLQRLLDAAFVAVLQFYRANRGRGPTAIDHSSFFQRRTLHEQFEVFLSEKPDTVRGRIKRMEERFLAALDSEEGE
jgi:AIPR protein